MASVTASLIIDRILDYVQSPANTLNSSQPEPAWSQPLVGFAAGNDPLWQEIKADIGPFYLTPAEVFAATMATVSSDDLTVITWVLPQTEKTRADNRKETAFPSERWARSRKFGEAFNVQLHAHLVEFLQGEGVAAVAPHLSPEWQAAKSERYGLSSRWSERHAAYVAGLGTFGLCDGLITHVGKSMRCGSVIARLQLPPTLRPYQNHQAYCLFFAKGVCGKCADRCPAGAITREHGHDKEKCQSYLHNLTNNYVETQFGFEAYGCGLCQGNVPCEGGVPVRR